MKLFCIVAVAAALFTTAVQADLSQLAAVLPPCALKCIVSSIPKSVCAPTNQTCICTDPQLNNEIALCVASSCTIRESLTCGAPVRDRTKVVSGAGVAGGVLAFLAFVLRMVARLPYYGGKFGLDDWVMVLTMMLVIPLTVLSAVLADLGLGLDMWRVPFDNITRILYIYYFDESIYLSILPLTKISICFFYLRIFPKKSFRIATYVVIGFNLAYLIVWVLISVFQCHPLNAAWLRWDGEYPGPYHCNNINAQAWAGAVVNMILDLVTMCLPLYELSHLNLSMRKKISVMFMFSLGTFVTVVSIIRLHSILEYGDTQNVTWDYVAIGYWSTIEVDVGVICACLPAMRSLFLHLFPGVFGTTVQGSTAATLSRSTPTASRLDKISQKPKEDTSDFVPLVDMDNSSQANLTGR